MNTSPMTNRGDVFMKTKGARRLLVVEQASAGKTTVREAGERIGLSSRHVIRRKNRFRKEETSGLVHKGRGCAQHARFRSRKTERNLLRLGIGASRSFERK